MAHYIHDEKNNRIEGMSKEEIYALLAAAIQQGQLPSVDEDTAFVTMFKSIVDGKTYKMGFCTQAQYNQLEAQGELVADAYYIITDDTSYNDIINLINNLTAADTSLQASIEALDERLRALEYTMVYNHLIRLTFNQSDTTIMLNVLSRYDGDVVDWDTLIGLLDGTERGQDSYYLLATGVSNGNSIYDCEITITNNGLLIHANYAGGYFEETVDGSSDVTYLDVKYWVNNYLS